MRYIGSVDNFQRALEQAQIVSKKEGKRVVLERAKYKKGVSLLTTYRGWLDLDTQVAEVMDMRSWDIAHSHPHPPPPLLSGKKRRR